MGDHGGYRMRKLTLKQSEWLWALNRGKTKQYYADRYAYGTKDFTIKIAGWIVKDILSSSDHLLKRAWELFNMNFTQQLIFTFPNSNGLSQELCREEIVWLMFSSTAYNLTKDDMDKIVNEPWRGYWNQLDKEFERKEKESSIAILKSMTLEDAFEELHDAIFAWLDWKYPDAAGFNVYWKDNYKAIEIQVVDALGGIAPDFLCRVFNGKLSIMYDVPQELNNKITEFYRAHVLVQEA